MRFFTTIYNLIYELLKEKGPISSYRAAFLFSVVISNLSIFFVWIYLCILQNAILSIDQTVIILYGLSNGMVIGGKLIQRNIEKIDDPSKKESNSEVQDDTK